MRYNAVSTVIDITVKEFVNIAKRRLAPVPISDGKEPRSAPKPLDISAPLSDTAPTALALSFTLGEHSFNLFSDEVNIKRERIYATAEIRGEQTSPDKETEKQVRAEAFINGYIYAKERKCSSVLLTFIYHNPDLKATTELEERVSIGKLTTFFERCRISFSIYARPEIERVTKRLLSLSSLRFPYPEIREGQRAFIHAAHRAISRGGRLVGGAPTGTGKTVSAIYPALRAYGNGSCDKIFYFTPKATTAEAAKECLNRMTGCGGKIRAIIISSKESSCESGLICHNGRGSCPNGSHTKICDAAITLFSLGITVVTLEDVRRVAREFRVCPYELELTYSELCDVVICDFNYLLDPDVYIRRYFDNGGNYAFLFDEAHNVPDRAQNIYSAEISDTELSAPLECELIGEHSALKKYTKEALEIFKKLLDDYLRDETRLDGDGKQYAATHVCEPPYKLYPLFARLISLTEAELVGSYLLNDENAEKRTSFYRSYLFTLKKFNSALERYNSDYEVFMFLSAGLLRIKLFCKYPGGEISRRLDLGGSSIFFSATLSPLHYYRSMLGLDRTAELIEVESPFTTGQLSVSVMDKISTRYSEREDTLGAVCRVIAATVSAKRGNYMIFSPSFAYSDALAEAFQKKYPKIQVLTQKRNMTRREKSEFIEKFKNAEDKSYLIGFCVMGGIYSEGIDLAGDSLIGAVIVGIGIPQLSYEREAMRAYYDDKYEQGTQFAYVYPGINRVLQAGGRVIRREDDYGVLVLIDDRFDDPIYKKTMPALWRGMKFIPNAQVLREELDRFWREVDSDRALR